MIPGEDLDGDGWTTPADCDDDDPDIHPDADEVAYNGIDEDCDGEDLADVDGDGWDGEGAGGADCADANPAIHPGADELCDNGRDDDCDGDVDEGCAGLADPAQPGGLAWTCATPGAPAGGLGWILLLGLLARRR